MEAMLWQIGRRALGPREGRAEGHHRAGGPKVEWGRNEGDQYAGGPHTWRCGTMDTCRIRIRGARKYL
jgi:hypothetical protein